MSGALAIARTSFELPEELHATEPPEARGLHRDEIRLLAVGSDQLRHVRFRDLGELLAPGDLLVVNTSATLAAAVDGIRPDGKPVIVHFSAPADDGTWVIELRGGRGPLEGAAAGDLVYLPDGVRVEILQAHPDSRRERSRLWRAHIELFGPVEDFLERYGRAITYDYLRGTWPLSAYQTIFARERGSAEMPSAARPFTEHLVVDLITRGIAVAPILLHAGVSSLEVGELPQEERYEVPESTARMVNETRASGGKVIAVGTTVTRALETVAGEDGSVRPGHGLTDLVLGPLHPARVVDGLITGWHAPKASHLSLLEAVAGPEQVQRAYDEAIGARYLWHEFGDSCMFLPRQSHHRMRRMRIL